MPGTDDEIPANELLVDVEDGIVVGLYHYLWMKDGKGRACPEVNIPHTIVFINGRPAVWYFTSVKERCIKRKNTSSISNAAITTALAPAPRLGAGGYGGEAKPSGQGGDPWATGASYSPGASPSASPSVSPARRRHGGDPDPQLDQQTRKKLSPEQRKKAEAEAREKAQAGRLVSTLGWASGSVERHMDGSSTGAALGPWPHHGVCARYQGTMTLPHNAPTDKRGRPKSPKRRVKQGAELNPGATFDLQDEAVEWFNRDQLRELLPPAAVVVHGVAALHEGVLQRFVQQRGQNHFVIRATWSPHACLVERRTSKAKMNDPRVPLSERLASFDAPIWAVENTIITGSVLQGTINRLCDNVAAHLADVSGGGVRVLRMVLFFSVDEHNRIWLTHCGTLKTQRPRDEAAAAMGAANTLGRNLLGGGPPVRLRTTGLEGFGLGSGEHSMGAGMLGLDLPAPHSGFAASKAVATIGGGGEYDDGPIGGSGKFLCVMTGEMYPGSQRRDVVYKQLLQHWFSMASQLPNEGDRLRAMDTIPLAIRRANPSLTREWYLRVRSQPNFLYRTAPVCVEAAALLAPMAMDDLNRTSGPRTSGGIGTMPPAGVGRQTGITRSGGAAARLRPIITAASSPPGSPAKQTRGPGQAQANGRPAGRSKSATPAGARANAGSGGGGSFLTAEPRSGPSEGRVGPGRPSGVGNSGLPSMLVPREGSHSEGLGRVVTAWDAPAGGTVLQQMYAPTPEQAAEAAAMRYGAVGMSIESGMEGAGLGLDGRGDGDGDGEDGEREGTSPGDAPEGSPFSYYGPGNGASGSTTPVAELPATTASTMPWGAPSPNSLAKRESSNSRRNLTRASASSEVTEVGSEMPNSEPSSPNNTQFISVSAPSNSNQHLTHHIHPSGSGGGAGSSGLSSSARMSPPRSAGVPTLHTIHEEGAAGPPHADDRPPSRGTGSHSVPRMRPQTRGGTDRPSPPGGAGNRRQLSGHGHYHGAPYPGFHAYTAGSGASAVAHRSLSESGDLPVLMPGGSLNSTMASSAGSVSRRSTSNNALLSADDLRTLSELKEAYTAAEKLTQQLLAQAHEVLSEEGSRPGSNSPSPQRAPRQGLSSAGSATATGSLGGTGTSRQGSGSAGAAMPPRQLSGTGSTGAGARASTGAPPPSRPAGLPTGLPSRSSTSNGLGPSPLGQGGLSRQGSSRRRGSGPYEVSHSGEAPVSIGGGTTDGGLPPLAPSAPPPTLPSSGSLQRPPSGGSAAALARSGSNGSAAAGLPRPSSGAGSASGLPRPASGHSATSTGAGGGLARPASGGSATGSGVGAGVGLSRPASGGSMGAPMPQVSGGSGTGLARLPSSRTGSATGLVPQGSIGSAAALGRSLSGGSGAAQSLGRAASGGSAAGMGLARTPSHGSAAASAAASASGAAVGAAGLGGSSRSLGSAAGAVPLSVSGSASGGVEGEEGADDVPAGMMGEGEGEGLGGDEDIEGVATAAMGLLTAAEADLLAEALQD
ncbi:hypothetical protein HYH03_004455 [Edaphochlamys debaryana]|uniref:Uncharacterized protein n=1 Tax=Edaphochlamys debaryana TaxID=47281 RepID=A0A835YHG8_9CHLO|nr:hypothetical protein HYH03_004455 [Edaphochlamys debaryana]|eukprot:KAG2497719.1 hypothetical protein HYH03_004455 [Edaphochlamys debaryana]